MKKNFDTQYISENSPYLDKIIALGDLNKSTLGFLPQVVFVERARDRQLLAIIDGEDLAGYILFYPTGGKVRITHLCVADNYRGQGVARTLVNELIDSKKYSAIVLNCRRDNPAWEMWKALGFTGVADTPGRGKDLHSLTVFRLQLSNDSLFQFEDDIDKSRLSVTIDANIFYDIDDPTRDGAEETQGLLEDWIYPQLQICITDELLNDILNHDVLAHRERMRSISTSFDQLAGDHDAFCKIEAELKYLIKDNNSPRAQSDRRHLARTLASKSEIFLTRDRNLLDHGEIVFQKYNLSILSPHQLIANIQKYQNASEFQQKRLEGTSIASKRLNELSEIELSLFVKHGEGEKLNELKRKLKTAIASPEKQSCKTTLSEDGKPLSLCLSENVSPNQLNVIIFRMSSSAIQSRIVGTLIRTLLMQLVLDAKSNGQSIVKICDSITDQRIVDALVERGFISTTDGWAKLVINKIGSQKEIADHIASISKESGINSPQIEEMVSVLEEPLTRLDTHSILMIEHLIWPGKITGTSVPCYIVPIKPKWARGLFDSGLAKQQLWASDPHLLLNPDSVYYRSIKPQVIYKVGRILWYVSADNKHLGGSCIRACSQLTNYQTGEAKEMFKRYERFGVYRWNEIKSLSETTANKGKVMAIEFTDTELFQNIISYQTAVKCLEKYKSFSNFQSPVSIEEQAFFELYNLG
ncbi:Acetyltransferase (GNAT) family protein [Gimesia maris]|uniref:GNAT family N-acetyltransferase n=1 Tax=Gimesia maris TaxID=122 RepID=UPI001187BD9B|nr:GNAT family N-acetyltransferase [Gimesia maris]QDU16892.1 Acetyltransferase (GNAT) family protein [Gimesia maris]